MNKGPILIRRIRQETIFFLKNHGIVNIPHPPENGIDLLSPPQVVFRFRWESSLRLLLPETLKQAGNEQLNKYKKKMEKYGAGKYVIVMTNKDLREIKLVELDAGFHS